MSGSKHTADAEQAFEWAQKVAASKPPRYTDASRNAAQFILAIEGIPDPAAFREVFGELVRDAQFLCERLREFERDLTELSETNNYFGHCQPALARMEASLATLAKAKELQS